MRHTMREFAHIVGSEDELSAQLRESFRWRSRELEQSMLDAAQELNRNRILVILRAAFEPRPETLAFGHPVSQSPSLNKLPFKVQCTHPSKR